MRGVISPVTLAETLIHPFRNNDQKLIDLFFALLTRGPSIRFVPTNEAISLRASQIRAKYNVHLLDAIQLATAIETECGAFLTNDVQLKRVEEIEVIVLQEQV